MNIKNIKWLYSELPKLAAGGAIPEESIQKIKTYYGEPEEANWLKILLGIFGTLGAILIGSGIILLFARNWDELNITARTILSLAPLIIAQILCGWVLLKKKNSFVWAESSTAFLTLAVGAGISLISQTYNISGDIANFIITWMLLILPLIYIFDAVTPAGFYLTGITFWAGFSQAEGGNAALYWLLFAALVPFLIKKLKAKTLSNRSVILLWMMSIDLCIALGIVLEKVLPGLWIVIYSSYFTVLLLVDMLSEREPEFLWQKPLSVVGTLGTIVMSFIFTFKFFWEDIGWDYYRHENEFNGFAGIIDYILVFLLLASALFLFYKNARRKDFISTLYSTSPLLAAICYIIGSISDLNTLPALLYNIFVFVLGVGTIIYGINKQKLGPTNGGMLVITLLIIMRFFDSDLGFLERGISFILVGTGFIVSNIVLLKKRKEVSVDEK
ncbi:DUF2157 domain-containing protein [Acetivibrio cellulolyticus]|uniref:DUF2157 domain-containing protein n=1 Tax=Acetivibrio cellulolyticus TaxID=35830 RepID=UPI0001E2E718|nr:DUF2157 domain-containing protein [Acetivibrio cellulolyticus]